MKKAPRVILEILAHRDFLVNQDLKEMLVNQVSMVSVVFQDPLENLVFLALQVLWVSLARLDLLV